MCFTIHLRWTHATSVSKIWSKISYTVRVVSWGWMMLILTQSPVDEVAKLPAACVQSSINHDLSTMFILFPWRKPLYLRVKSPLIPELEGTVTRTLHIWVPVGFPLSQSIGSSIQIVGSIFHLDPMKIPLKTLGGEITVYNYVYNNRRKFRSETSDNMDSWKAEVKRVRREKIRRKKMQMREKVGKSRNTVFFQWFGAPEGRKVGSLKRRVRSQLARWEMKNCTPLWREAHFQVKMYKTPQRRTTFGSWDVEKVHAVVARSTFRSQNVKNTRGSDHFWKLRCWKSARRCGAKHISKSKCTKHTILGPLLEVAMSKKCTPLWREAHFQVKQKC